MKLSRQLTEQSIIKAIRKFAKYPDSLTVRDYARKGMMRLRITDDAICESIVTWIDSGKPIDIVLSSHEEHLGEPLFVMYPEINGEVRYVKIKLLPSPKKADRMVLISAQEQE